MRCDLSLRSRRQRKSLGWSTAERNPGFEGRDREQPAEAGGGLMRKPMSDSYTNMLYHIIESERN